MAPAKAAAPPWHGCTTKADRHGFFRTADGTRIAYAEHGSGRTGVVLAHGASSDLCSFASMLHDPRLKDFRLLAFDFRGGGLSDYPQYPRSTRVRQDVAGAVAQIRRDGARKVVVLGLSRGGPPALAAAADLYPKQVQGAVAVASIDSALADDAVASVHRSRVPLLVLVNAHDGLDLTPVSRRIYRASIARDKQLVLAPGRGHADVFGDPPSWNAFIRFLHRR